MALSNRAKPSTSQHFEESNANIWYFTIWHISNVNVIINISQISKRAISPMAGRDNQGQTMEQVMMILIWLPFKTSLMLMLMAFFNKNNSILGRSTSLWTAASASSQRSRSRSRAAASTVLLLHLVSVLLLLHQVLHLLHLVNIFLALRQILCSVAVLGFSLLLTKRGKVPW